MESALRITVRFLQPYSHGRGEDGSPEWPPSPLRLFQALVAAVFARETDAARRARAIESLQWLEAQDAPEIYATEVASSDVGYRTFVPDNAGDVVAKAWSAGRAADLAAYRSEKDVRPLRLRGDGSVHYVFRGAAGTPEQLELVRQAARSITHLGWAIDMAVGDATDDPTPPSGERWLPGRANGPLLRRPVRGTLADLERKHAQFLSRLDGGVLRPVSPLAAFETTRYARATDPFVRPFAAFRLVDAGTGDRLSLNTARRSRDVAAWTRHAVSEVCKQWPFGSTDTIVHGHGGHAAVARPRFSYLPLPTISVYRRGGNACERVDDVARVVVVGPEELDREIRWLRANLAGHDLVWRDETVAVLEPLVETDWVLGRYVSAEQGSCAWSTVTPVVLPGHDDGTSRKAERLLKKAFLQAGIAQELVDSMADLEWRKVGFRAGVDHANRYLTPDKITGPTFHVRVRFAHRIAGPLAIGSGRHRGMGIFARE